MYIGIKEVIDIVEKLNDEWWRDADNPDNFYPFEVRACGGEIAVYFLGETIWCTEEDLRSYDEQSDSYEPLESFLRCEVRKLAHIILEAIVEQ